MSDTTIQPTVSPLRQLFQSEWLRPLNDRTAINDLLGQMHPLWSLDQIRARVEAVVTETPDTKTFLLRTNRHWKGFQAGQHVVVEVEIDGVRHHRTYSLSSAPGTGRSIALTVKRQGGGKVSEWMHRTLRRGDVVGLSPAMGDFTLPKSLPKNILLLSAGSGVTPVMSLLRELQARHYAGSVVFMQACRTRADRIFGQDLERLSRSWPALTVQWHESATQGRLDVAGLQRAVPDYLTRETWLCGRTGFAEQFIAHWQEQGQSNRLRCEFFGAPIRALPDENSVAAVRCSQSDRQFTARAGAPLLSEAEIAGLKPKHGCRIGICQACKCVKRSGTVRNLTTGKLSSEANELIQLCVSSAASDLHLEI